MISQETDYNLVHAFVEGDAGAFNQIAARYQDKIYWHARRMTGNHLDADDIVQEVLLVLYEKLKGFQFKSSLYTWIFRITATRSLNLLQRRKIRNFFSFDDEETGIELPSGENVEMNVEMKDKMEKLDGVLQKLPAKQREVFLLRNFEQMTYEEIAEITGKSIGALKANYFHAIDKVQNLMKEYI